jgi:CelD/BcsL family acetyltransferase involved in cellulose biosynthesis
MTRSYAIELLDTNGLRNLEARQWDELSAQALDDNPFYARTYMLAGLGTIDTNANISAVAVRENGQLVGLFPFRLKRWPLQLATAAGNLYQFSSQPLVHRDHARGVVAAWLDAIETGAIPRRWTFRNIGLSSSFLRHVESLDGSSAAELIPFDPYARARLTRLTGGFETHLESVMSRSRTKDIRRNIRRLGELGELRFERQGTPEAVAERIEDFLAIEHGGWKGQAGTSFLADAAHAEFARRAFCGDGAARTSVDSLVLNGKPIAISINLQAGDTMFTPKCAYDEAYRKYTPGLVLEYFVIEAFYRGGECSEMDSATTVDGHVIQGLWNDEIAMGTVLVGPRGWQTRMSAFVQQSCAAVKKATKGLIGDSKVREISIVARDWRRKIQATQHSAMIGGAGFLHAVELVAPAL